MLIVFFGSTGKEMSPIPNSCLTLHTQLASRENLVKLSFCVRRFHNCSFFENHSSFLPLQYCWNPHPPESVDWEYWEHRRYRLCTSNENKPRIVSSNRSNSSNWSNLHENVSALENMCMIPLAWRKYDSVPFLWITTEWYRSTSKLKPITQFFEDALLQSTILQIIYTFHYNF